MDQDIDLLQNQRTSLEFQADELPISNSASSGDDARSQEVASLRRQISAIDTQIAKVNTSASLIKSDSSAAKTKIESLEIQNLLPSRGITSLIAFVLNTLLALPDAYLDVIKNLLPNVPFAARIVVVIIIFGSAFVIADQCNSAKPALWFLVLLPAAASLLAGLCTIVASGFAFVFHSNAPTVSVTSTTVLTPAFYWTSTKIAEHHLVEAILHRLPKSLMEE